MIGQQNVLLLSFQLFKIYNFLYYLFIVNFPFVKYHNQIEIIAKIFIENWN